MSKLSSIVLFVFAIQLAANLLPYIEVTPGHFLLPSSIASPFITVYNPMNDIVLTLNSSMASFNSIVKPSTNAYGCGQIQQGDCAYASFSFMTCENSYMGSGSNAYSCIWIPTGVSGICIKGSSCTGDKTKYYSFYIQRILLIPVDVQWVVAVTPGTIVGVIPSDFIGTLYLLSSLLIVLINATITTVFSMAMVVLMLIVNVTIGAIPFYTGLFSLIDPVFGTYLGIALGSMQAMVVVVYGLYFLRGTSHN
jgi:hypothetical protein